MGKENKAGKLEALSAIQRRGWPAWIALLVVIILIVEIILICGSSSLLNLIIPIAADLERPTDPTTTRNAVNSLAFSPDQVMLASGSGDGVVRLWQMVDGRLMRSLKTSQRPVSSLAFSPTGDFIVVGTWDGRVSLWQPDSGYFYDDLVLEHPVRSVAYHPQQNQIAIGTLEGDIYLWHPLAGTAPIMLPGHTDSVTQLRYSPSGDILASAAQDGDIRLWDPADGSLSLSFSAQSKALLDLAFAPSGEVLVSTSFDRGLSFWQVSQGVLLNTGSYQEPTWRVDFSADGQWLAVGAQGYIDLWNIADSTVTKNNQARLQSQSQFRTSTALLSLTFAPKENWLVAGSRDGRIILWRVQDDGVLQHMRSWILE